MGDAASTVWLWTARLLSALFLSIITDQPIPPKPTAQISLSKNIIGLWTAGHAQYWSDEDLAATMDGNFNMLFRAKCEEWPVSMDLRRTATTSVRAIAIDALRASHETHRPRTGRRRRPAATSLAAPGLDIRHTISKRYRQELRDCAIAVIARYRKRLAGEITKASLRPPNQLLLETGGPGTSSGSIGGTNTRPVQTPADSAIPQTAARRSFLHQSLTPRMATRPTTR